MSFFTVLNTLIKKKIKLSSYIGKFRVEQLQSHIWLTASSYMGKYFGISSYIRKPFLIYEFATAPLWISLYIRKVWFSFLSVYACTKTVHCSYCILIALCPRLLSPCFSAPHNRITKFSNLLNIDQRGILTMKSSAKYLISQDVNKRELIFLKCNSVLSSFEIRNNFAKLLAEVAVSRKGIPMLKGTGSLNRIQILRQK